MLLALAIAVGVALTAAAVSVCGPVAFIALTAPRPIRSALCGVHLPVSNVATPLLALAVSRALLPLTCDAVPRSLARMQTRGAVPAGRSFFYHLFYHPCEHI